VIPFKTWIAITFWLYCHNQCEASWSTHKNCWSPAMEYAAPVWHTGLTAELTKSLESVQKRALKIIFRGNSFTNSIYLSFCESLAISSLQSRRETLSANFFPKILDPSCCLHYLIPNQRSGSQLNKPRNHSFYSPPFTKFKSSFLLHALYHYVHYV